MQEHFQCSLIIKNINLGSSNDANLDQSAENQGDGDVLDEVLKFIFGSHWFQQRAHLKAPIRAKNSFQKLYFLLCIISQDTTK